MNSHETGVDRTRGGAPGGGKLKGLWKEYGSQALIIVLGLSAVVVVQGRFLAGPHPLEGLPAPPFTLPLLGGGELDLAAHLGKEPVVLDFWATWCPPCREALPVLDRVAGEFAGRGVRFYTVNIAEPPEAVAGFLERNGVGLPTALDGTMAVSELYTADYIPQTVFIGRDGVVAKVHTGVLGADTLRREIDALLAPAADAAAGPGA